MDLYMLILRIIHIFGGVFWVGATAINLIFLVPAVRNSGAEGMKFMQTLMGHHRFPVAIGTSAWLTILAGILLYWRDSAGLQLSWIASPVGMGFTVGALAGLAGFLLGGFVVGPTARKFGGLMAQLQAQGAPPTAEQQAEIEKLGARMNTLGRLELVVLVIALLGMATARYWWF